MKKTLKILFYLFCISGWFLSVIFVFVIKDFAQQLTHPNPVENPFPILETIKSVRYKNSCFIDSKRVEIDHAVPKEDVKSLSLLFEGARLDSPPLKWRVAGKLIIELNSGKKREISLFKTFKGLSAFKIGSQYYRGGIDEQFEKLLIKLNPNKKNPE